MIENVHLSRTQKHKKNLPAESTSFWITAFKRSIILFLESNAVNKTSATPVASAAGHTSQRDKATSISDSTSVYYI